MFKLIGTTWVRVFDTTDDSTVLHRALDGHADQLSIVEWYDRNGLTTGVTQALPAADAHVALLRMRAPTPAELRIAFERIRTWATGPVVLSVLSDSRSLLEEALDLGIFDVVPDRDGEIVVDQLLFSLQRARVIGRARPQAGDAAEPEPDSDETDDPEGMARTRAHVVTVFSPKGGAGRTSIAVNLAASWSRAGLRTLLFDCDLQGGDAAIMLGLTPQRTVLDTLSSSGDPADAHKIHAATIRCDAGFDLLAAPLDPSGSLMIDAERILDVIDVARNEWDVIVIDTPARMGENTLAVLDRTDDLLIVTTPDIASVRRTQFVEQELERVGYPCERWHFVLNQAGRPWGLTPKMFEQTIGARLYMTLPFDDAVPLAENCGVPAIVKGSSSPWATAIASLACLLEPHTCEIRARGGWLSRHLGRSSGERRATDGVAA